MTEREKQILEEARNNLYDAISGNEEHFEVKITAISSGAIALSLTYLATLDHPRVIGLIFAGVALSIFSLGMNMWGYLYFKTYQRKMIDNLEQRIKSGRFLRDPNKTLKNHDKIIDTFNQWNLVAMLWGIILSSVFVFINT